MSYGGYTYTCPKCGFESVDMDVCDSCGALIAKTQQRQEKVAMSVGKDMFEPEEVVHDAAERASRAASAPDPKPPPASWTSMLGAVSVVAAAIYFAVTGISLEKFTKVDETKAGIVKMDNADFKSEVIKSNDDRLFVVMFHSPGEERSRAFVPEFARAAMKLKAKATFAKIDVESADEVKNKFGVVVLPALLIYKRGAELEHITGGEKSRELIQRVESHI